MSAPDSHSPLHSDYDEKVDVVSEHAVAAAREKPDPKEGAEPVSLWAFFIAGIALIVGAGYLGATNGGFQNDGFTFVEGYTVPPPPGLGEQAEALPPAEAWMKEGEKQYKAVCAACHQGHGKGQPGAFPPLAGSEWVVGGTERLAMIILNGLQGPITVSGSSYNGIMTPWRDALNDKQIAQVMGYIRRSWGNADALTDEAYVSPEMVRYARETHQIPGMTVSHLQGFDKDLPGAKLDPETLEPMGEGGTSEGGDAEAAAEE